MQFTLGRSRPDQDLAKAAARYRAFIAATGHIAWVTNARGEVEEDLPTFRAYTGQRRDQVLGSGWSGAIHPDDVARTLQVWREAVAEKRDYQTEYRLRRHDGSYRLQRARGYPVLGSRGEIAEWVGTCVDIENERLSELALAISESRVVTAFGSAQDAQAIVRAADGRILDVNEAFLRAFKAARSDAIGSTCAELGLWSEDADRDRSRLILAEPERALVQDVRFAPPGEAPRDFVCSGAAISASGERCILTAWRDVTEERRTLAALREARETLEHRIQERTAALEEMMAYNRSLLESSADALFAVASDGRITDVNDATVKATGRTRMGLVGSSFAESFSAPPAVLAALQRAFREGVVADHPVLLLRADGEATPVDLNLSVYRGRSGAVAGVFAAAHDVTEALRARAELEQKQLLLDQTARLARVGGWEIDLVRGSLSWTDMVYEIHEVERSYQPSVQTGIQFYAPEAVPVISEAVRRAIEVQEPFDLELPLVTAKGTRLWVRAIGKALIEDGVTRRVTGVFQDLTAKKKAEDELEQYRRHLEQMVTDRTADLKRSNADLEQFAYVASHDLQEPLRMVASFTQLLADEYAGKLDQKAGTYIEFAVSGARRMQGLINDLLAYSRIGSRKPPLAPVPCGQVVSEVLLGLGQAVEEAGAQVRVGPLPSVQADRAQLTQVFQNLIGNALKFRGGRAPIIDVSARPEGASWVFEVRDNGIGIDPQDFERVFVIFQRLHDRGAYPGNGIGLPLVKKIVERHGGRIWIESEPGAGSRFLFTLTSQGDAHA